MISTNIILISNACRIRYIGNIIIILLKLYEFLVTRLVAKNNISCTSRKCSTPEIKYKNIQTAKH